MMVGYANEHASGTYRIYMLRTGRVIETRDVFWLDMYYGQWLNGDDSHDLAEYSGHDDGSDNDDESEVFVYEHDDPKDANPSSKHFLRVIIYVSLSMTLFLVCGDIMIWCHH